MTLRADKGAILSWDEMDSNFKACMGVHNLLHVYDLKTTGQNGGTFTSGAWRTRTLNTVGTNTISGASLAANRVTLPAGVYFAHGLAPCTSVNNNALRLQSITSSSTLIVGQILYSYSDSVYAHTVPTINGVFSILSVSDIELQHICQVTKADTGLGSNNVGLDTDAKLAELLIWKLS